MPRRYRLVVRRQYKNTPERYLSLLEEVSAILLSLEP